MAWWGAGSSDGGGRGRVSPYGALSEQVASVGCFSDGLGVEAQMGGAGSVIPTPAGPKRAAFEMDEMPPAELPDDLREAEVEPADSILPRPTRTRIMVVVNQKGGVGKTTTAVNVATGLALGGLRVLLIDMDPQGNASTALAAEHDQGVGGTYEVLIEQQTIAEHEQASPEAPNLWVLPATIDLAGAELELVAAVSRETRMKRAIREYLGSNSVDYVIMDCPPSLGLLTLNALVAADEILIPIQCEYYALEGVAQLMRTIELVKGGMNDDLVLSTVVLTMYDGRTRLSAQVADEVRTYFAEETLDTVIPRSVRVAEAPSYGQSVLTYQPHSIGAQAYLRVAEEIASRGVPS